MLVKGAPEKVLGCPSAMVGTPEFDTNTYNVATIKQRITRPCPSQREYTLCSHASACLLHKAVLTIYDTRDYLCEHGIIIIPLWICNQINFKLWDEITYQFTKINVVAVKVWEWISNFISYFTGHVIFIHIGIEVYSNWQMRPSINIASE